VEDLVDEIIAEEFASPDLELHWLDEDDGDPETVLADRVKLGAPTLNEMRSAIGLDPYANPAADRPMALTATGYVPIEAGASSSSPAGLTRGPMRPSRPTNCRVEPRNDALLRNYNPDQPRVPAGNPDGGQWAIGGESEPADDVSDSTDGASRSSISSTQLVAAGGLRCDGISSGCQSGGSYGTSGMYNIDGRVLCMDCAIKFFSLQDESPKERARILDRFLIGK
jgi:hypothetical protein